MLELNTMIEKINEKIRNSFDEDKFKEIFESKIN